MSKKPLGSNNAARAVVTRPPGSHSKRKSTDLKLNATFELIDKAFEVNTEAELEELMASALRDYGIENFAVNELRAGKRQMIGRQRFGRPEQAWAARYMNDQMYLKDDVVKMVIQGPSPIWWDKMERDYGLSPDTQRIFDGALEHGLEDGFVVPVHRTDSSISSVAFTATQKLDLSSTDEACLRLIALYYVSFGELLAAKASQNAQPRVELTSRQIECLQWVREGKTSWEISVILGLSERTVIFHIEEACTRLGVKTRTQAVIEALIQGHIHL
jgi:LuxR family transcriptional regulator, transcriptional activator of the bioluminescence operon